MLKKVSAERYGLTVTKDNDQRFDIDYASDAAARYLKDLYRFFGNGTSLGVGKVTIPVADPAERKKFALAAYNGGEGRIAGAQRQAWEADNNPSLWETVKEFLEAANATTEKAKEIRNYVPKVMAYEIEFDEKSPADKDATKKEPKKIEFECTDGHWITKDGKKIMICD